MGSRRGFIGTLNYIARESAKAQRRAEQAQRRYEADVRRSQRDAERNAKQLQKEQKQRYLESRLDEVNDLNEDIKNRLEELSLIIKNTLIKDDTIDFESLKDQSTYAEFNPPYELIKNIKEPAIDTYINAIPKPSFLSKILKSLEIKYQKNIEEAKEKYALDKNTYINFEKERKEKLAQLKSEFERQKEIFNENQQKKNEQVDNLKLSLKNGQEDGVITYFSMVLERSEYPDGFPQDFDLEYNAKEASLFIEYFIPDPSIVPNIQEFSYNKSKDIVVEKNRNKIEIKSIYENLVSSLALRTIHEIIESDQFKIIKSVRFEGIVPTTDKSTGNEINAKVISVTVTPEKFLSINLEKVDSLACIQNLNSKISTDLLNLKAVK
jgi:restriction system protein